MLQRFDFIVKDRKGTENQVPDMFSISKEDDMLNLGNIAERNDVFQDEQVLAASHDLIP